MATAAQAAGATADSAANGTQARASAGDAALQAAVARTARIAAQGANGRGGDEGAGVPPSFVCPITHELMVDPVSTVDGQVYERAAIEAWLRNNDTSPITNETLLKLLIPNHPLRAMIAEYVESRAKSS